MDGDIAAGNFVGRVDTIILFCVKPLFTFSFIVRCFAKRGGYLWFRHVRLGLCPCLIFSLPADVIRSKTIPPVLPVLRGLGGLGEAWNVWGGVHGALRAGLSRAFLFYSGTAVPSVDVS